MARRYDDGGIEFGQEQFDKAREYKEEQAEKQEKFSKRLQIANMGVTGFTGYLNHKADILEANGIAENAHRFTQLENAKTWQAMIKGYNDKGIYNRKEMLYQETLSNLRTKLQTQFGEDYDISIYDDKIEDLAREYSSNENNLKSWNKTIDAQLAIPKMSQDDLKNLIIQEIKAPRNGAAWFGNKLTKVAKSWDEETLTAADKEAKSKMLGGLIGEKFKAAKDAIAEYGETSGRPIGALVEFMKTDEGKEFASKVTKDKQFLVRNYQKKDGYGNTVTIQRNVLVGVGRGDRGPIEFGESVDVSVIETEAPEKLPNAVELKIIGNQISTFLDEENNPELNNAYEVFLDNGDGEGLILNVHSTVEILRQKYGISQSKAVGMAVHHILSQPSPYKETKVTAYEVDKLLEIASDYQTGYVDTEKTAKYIDDILKIYPDESITRIENLYNEFKSAIEMDFNLDEDTKRQELISLNKLVKPYIEVDETLNLKKNIVDDKIKETYSQEDIEKGVPEQDELIANHGELQDSLLELTYKVTESDKRSMSGLEYERATEKVANNAIKIKQFKEKFGISYEEVLKTLEKEQKEYRELLASMGAAAQYSPLSPAEVYKTYDNDTLTEMLAFMNL